MTDLFPRFADFPSLVTVLGDGPNRRHPAHERALGHTQAQMARRRFDGVGFLKHAKTCAAVLLLARTASDAEYARKARTLARSLARMDAERFGRKDGTNTYIGPN